MSSAVIIDYGSGNLRSAEKALRHVLPEGMSLTVTDDSEAVAKADRIILPGVGAFADCMRGLKALPGMQAVLERRVREENTPFLGICVGMQLLARTGYEHGKTAGLGWIDAEVVPLEPADTACKIPHMGWNQLTLRDSVHPWVRDISTGNHAYFVHSYHMRCRQPEDIIATTDHGGAVAAIVARANIMGVQFHPEKSQHTGLAVLRRFLT